MATPDEAHLPTFARIYETPHEGVSGTMAKPTTSLKKK